MAQIVFFWQRRGTTDQSGPPRRPGSCKFSAEESAEAHQLARETRNPAGTPQEMFLGVLSLPELPGGFAARGRTCLLKGRDFKSDDVP